MVMRFTFFSSNYDGSGNGVICEEGGSGNVVRFCFFPEHIVSVDSTVASHLWGCGISFHFCSALCFVHFLGLFWFLPTFKYQLG